MKIALHPKTKGQVASFIAKPTHALMLRGPLGSGKHYTAQYIALEILDTPPQKLSSHPFYREITAGDAAITIDEIRSLKQFMSLKTTGHSTMRRIIVIANAERMTTEAQNALLKSLEEPPADTLIILTTESTASLLPTITSRTQIIDVLKVPKNALQAVFEHIDATTFNRAYQMSNGRPGLFHALTNQESTNPLSEAANLAKTILQETPYERLLRVNELGSTDYAPLLESLHMMAHAALIGAAQKQDTTKTERWYRLCQLIESSQKAYGFKPQAKLHLSHLFINL